MLRLESLKISPEAFGSSYCEEVERPAGWFDDLLASSYVVGSFAEDETLVGAACLHIPSAAKVKHKGQLWGVYVTPEARGCNVARSIIEDILAYAKGEVEEVLLSVIRTNEPAVTLYRSLGFEVYGIERRVLKIGAEYHDEFLMTLHLHR